MGSSDKFCADCKDSESSRRCPHAPTHTWPPSHLHKAQHLQLRMGSSPFPRQKKPVLWTKLGEVHCQADDPELYFGILQMAHSDLNICIPFFSCVSKMSTMNSPKTQWPGNLKWVSP